MKFRYLDRSYKFNTELKKKTQKITYSRTPFI